MKVVIFMLVTIILISSIPISVNAIEVNATLIDDLSVYSILPYADKIKEKRVYENQVLVDGHIPVIVETEFGGVTINNLQKFLYKHTSLCNKEFKFDFELLINETFYKTEYTYKEVKEKDDNGSWITYFIVNQEIQVPYYRYVWKNIKELNSYTIDDSGFIVFDIVGYTTATTISWSIDIIPTINILNVNYTFSQFAWWNNSWSYSKKIVIDHNQIEENLYSYPICFRNKSADYTAHARADGYDFRFVNYDNSTRFHYEMEYYDSAIGNVTAWVNVTNISSQSDTKLWVYYGNAAANTRPIDEYATWNSGYAMVCHMNDSTTSTVFDSTRSGVFLGTKEAANNPQVELGKFAMGQNFTSDYIRLTNGLNYNPGTDDISYEFWWRPHVAAGLQWSYIKYEAANDKVYWYVTPGGTWYYLAKEGGADALEAQDAATTNNVNTWYYCVYSGDRDAHNRFWSNTMFVPDTTDTVDNGAIDVVTNFNFDFGEYAAANGITGMCDELRISTCPRNTSWINVTYITCGSPETFMTVGPEIANVIIFYKPWVQINYPLNKTTDICPCCDYLQFSINQSQGSPIDIYVFMNSTKNATYALVNVYAQWSNDTLAFCMDGWIYINTLQYYHQMEYNMTFYWYVYVVNHDDATKTNTSGIFHFKTAKNPRNCTRTNGTGGTTTAGGGYGYMLTNSVGVIGLIGCIGILGLIYKRRRR